MHGCQDAGSWPSGSTEGVVACDFPLERSGVERNKSLWNEPRGRVVDCSVPRRSSAPVFEAETWNQEQSKDQRAVGQTQGTGAWASFLWLFIWKIESEGRRILARSAGQISEEGKAEQEPAEENERSDGKDVDCNATPLTVDG